MDSDHHINQYQAEGGKRDKAASWLCVVTPGRSSRPEEAGKTQGAHFKQWIENYSDEGGKKRLPHCLERNTDAESSLCIGEKKETPIKRLEDAIHSLDWASGETRQLNREK